ncbi:MAG: pyridoxamine 5'-phosphate oxidase family protein [Rickettsiales bacterium]|nr:pyridoxamine 5'-phosphate oxidase family protein [Rickettsiales bacterium]
MNGTDKVVKFLQDAKVFYIATIDGRHARVRPFGAALNIGGKLAICTGSRKNVARQIAANPNVEISAMTADGKYIRVSGALADVSSDENRQKFFDFMIGLAGLYKGKEAELQILSFESATATIADLAGNSETINLE